MFGTHERVHNEVLTHANVVDIDRRFRLVTPYTHTIVLVALFIGQIAILASARVHTYLSSTVSNVHDKGEIIVGCGCQLESNIRSALLESFIEIDDPRPKVLVALAESSYTQRSIGRDGSSKGRCEKERGDECG